MSNIILALMLITMIVASLRSIRKPRAVLHIDEVITTETSHAGWGALPWLVSLVVLIFALRLTFGG